MELPRRPDGDTLLAPGEMTDIRRRLRAISSRHDLVTVIACAFDHRTRILPFIFADLRMVPAGVRAIGAAMLDSGFDKTRIVLQQWNRNFRPQEMRLDGRVPDIFMVSSMHLHSTKCDQLIQDANKMDPAIRPLIIAGGPRIIYSPWEVFSDSPDHPWGADVAVTGEEYVLLNLLEVLLDLRGSNESLRATFLRARDRGALDEIPGLVYALSTARNGAPEELVDTGIQQLLEDLDELPHATLGYRLLEPPNTKATLERHALSNNRVRTHSPISSIVMTVGCKFRCSYCPIPAYNQRQYRVKSGERIAHEMGQISESYGIVNFFGTDDNFFNNPQRTLEIADTLARKVRTGRRPYCKVRYGTEATVHDTIRLKEHLPVIRQSGLRMLWMGVEDVTASLVRKGQSEDNTLESFRLLRANGIVPIPMMMHHDAQPLVSWKSNYGLLNQLRTLRKAGALFTQVLMLTPSPGSKWFVDTYTSGCAFDAVDGRKVQPHLVDGNYVVASKHPRPWLKQLNLLVAYTYFYNPVRLLIALVFSKSTIPFADAESRPAYEVAQYSLWRKIRRWCFRKFRAHMMDAGLQVLGIMGLIQTYRRTSVWLWRLLRGTIQRAKQPPLSQIPMRSVRGAPASHALPGTAIGSLSHVAEPLTVLQESHCSDPA
ncbi:MAG: B12-binding domain-containing radical SAM protein [Pirellulaceae bacterium]